MKNKVHRDSTNVSLHCFLEHLNFRFICDYTTSEVLDPNCYTEICYESLHFSSGRLESTVQNA